MNTWTIIMTLGLLIVAGLALGVSATNIPKDVQPSV